MTTALPASEVHLAEWARRLGVTVAASIYARPASSRRAGALAAHTAGHWVHADIILEGGGTGALVNSGVEVALVRELLAESPAMLVDVHVIVRPGAVGWETAVASVAAELRGAGVARWSAVPAVLSILRAAGGLPAEQWVEVWPPRDGAEIPPGYGGALAMLIEPGSKGSADTSTLPSLIASAPGVSIGVDGGVTPGVASDAIRDGATYLVIGRALFAGSITAQA
ncbi:hypothetical protein BCR15_10680 [Tessaracoccus lapidicaptus]|uniref:Ribulose-phosphate 3-epimerase n=1 Tax=Tessaracoccus lapidicaptus TaxID=1427523 RepID=A0A1C0AGR0_9ACTN|nr:hypothetical protein [Tessaracoccus lapidicaptus]OCL30918.1 hypothetical protein BCR15_10680 [Tessaracoccus lapidicaptus]